MLIAEPFGSTGVGYACFKAGVSRLSKQFFP
jgi:hypothetical protein